MPPDPYDFFTGKREDKIYVSKRIEGKASNGEPYQVRYISKVVDAEERWEEFKLKDQIVLRTTSNERQEILAKVFEKNSSMYGITLQRFTKESGSPHKLSFSFVGNELQIFLDFIDSIKYLSYQHKHKFSVGDEKILEIKETLTNSPELIENIVKYDISDRDIISLGYRKKQLDIFAKLLAGGYLENYKREVIGSPNTKDEAAWQFFFNKNRWIFGYGLDYRFQGVLQKEFHSSNSEADGSNEVIGDFLLGDRKFTTFVELKRPDTALFGSSKNRSNSWKLSSDLIDAFSQILEQKASGQVKLAGNKLHNDSGQEIGQESHDSKTILVIGSWDELKSCDNDLERKMKTKTFELFRRDSRNVEILTFDELYERAKYIVDYSENT